MSHESPILGLVLDHEASVDTRVSPEQRRSLACFNVPAEALIPIEYLDFSAWMKRRPVPPGDFDRTAQAHWSADGVFFPPGVDPIRCEFTHPMFERAYRNGFLWSAREQNWISLPEPTPEVESLFDPPPVASTAEAELFEILWDEPMVEDELPIVFTDPFAI